MTLCVENITKKFKDKLVFEDFNIVIASNNLIVIEGENGSGKSTFFSLITGIDQDYEGKISLFSKDIKEYNTVLLNEISYCPQNSDVAKSYTVKDLTDLFLIDTETSEIENLANELDILKLSNKKFHKLSGGEKQKVLLMLTILRKSDVLIIDEFDNNLDKETVKKVIKILNNDKRLVIVSTHHTNFEHAKTLNINNPKDILDENLVDGKKIKNSLNVKKISKKYYETMPIFKLLTIGIIILLMVVTMFNISGLFETMKNDMAQFQEASDYKNNSMMIFAPITSPSVAYQNKEFLVGDDTTPYMTQEEYDEIASLEGVTKVTVTPNPYNGINTSVYEDIYIEYPLQSIPEKKEYNFIVNQPDEYNNVAYYSSYVVDPEISNNVPLYGYPQQSDMLYGTIPQESSNEVIIDDDLAMQLMVQYNFTDPDELLNNDITFYGSDLVTGEQKEIIIPISGIYTDANSASVIYGAYDPTSTLPASNMPSERQKLDYEITYQDEYANYQRMGGTMSFEEFETNNPNLIEVVYLEFETEEDMQNAYYYILENFVNFDVFCKERVENGVPTSHYISYIKYSISKVITTLIIILPILLVILFTWKKYKKKQDMFYIQRGLTRKQLNGFCKKEVVLLYSLAIIISVIFALLAHILLITILCAILVSSISIVLMYKVLKC